MKHCFTRNILTKFSLLYVLLVSILTFSCHSDTTLISFDTEVNENYKALNRILEEKKTQLVEYMNHTKNLASNIKIDEAMISFFKVKKEYYELSKDTIMPHEIVVQIEALKQKLQKHYLKHYIDFYDILFIDTNGEIFYTIRKEDDYHMNIFKGNLNATTLSNKLKENTSESFIDFQFYEVSGEPSAFFIEPIFEGGKNIGWIVMQCSINKINNMIVSNNSLGATGEILIVNKDHFMLTNSRFNVEPTILKQKLSAENIESKFNEKHGTKAVVDYRGKDVFSAFDVFNFLGSEWLIISKIDKNELVNKYYMANKDILYPLIEKYLNKKVQYNSEFILKKHETESVHMDEFYRGDTSKVLFSQGVATCTAINFSLPGEFAYLSHISPFDVIYGEQKTDITGQIFKLISYFEITESKKNKLEFQVMSTQTKPLKNLIDVIIENGYFLSQIKFMINSNADYGNIYCDIANKSTNVNWYPKNINNAVVSQNYDSVEDLESILMNIVVP